MTAATTARPREGLSTTEAARRLEANGPNQITSRARHRGAWLLLRQFTSPVTLILIGATILSMALGEFLDGSIILAIVAISGALGFWQEHRAGQALDSLLQRVQVTAEVLRDGSIQPVSIENIVADDVLLLRAGDIIPADCQILESQQLLADESALTGESFPSEKDSGAKLYSGTHVVSGTATVTVTHTGSSTQYAAIAARLASADVTTGFERGLSSFGRLLVWAMAVLVAAIFAINLMLDRPVVEAMLFALALAVGLTPQLLPAIVALSLAAGARRMASQQVIVKRLDAIEDFGAMTVLCTDKTGTLTAGVVALGGAYRPDGTPSDTVLRLARLNAGLQRGFANPLDAAILAGAGPPDPSLRLDEVPYDFSRQRLSVLALDNGKPLLVTKGALEQILTVCDIKAAERDTAMRTFTGLSARGYRVLGLAIRQLPATATVTAADETAMTFCGLLAFQDPVKADAAQTIRDLAGLGIAVKVITGDHRLAALHLAREVGLAAEVLTGADIDQIPDDVLCARAAAVSVFAQAGPQHKERIIAALRRNGEVVGFLGDGINDAPALHAADVGISVDTAVDVAKQVAAIVLLEKDLNAIADGVRLGRQTFANTLKYVRVTISANFGNMLSVAAASAFLPFLPLLPSQILLLNFLTDIPATTIATDNVDPQQLQRPRSWDIRGIRRFMIIFGLISTAFDLLTFLVLWKGFHLSPEHFRTGWFLESAATELAVMLVLRTSGPFYRTRPSSLLLYGSVVVAVITVALPYSPLGEPLGLAPLAPLVLATLGVIIAGYVAANEFAKQLAGRSSLT